jgi:hypothetical protein
VFTKTINITNAQETALQRLSDNITEAAGLPSQTAEEFFDVKIDQMIGSLREDYLALRRQEIFRALAGADNATLSQIEADLGL